MLNLMLNKDERGTSMAEFAIIAGVFFLVIIGIIEFGRLFYTHNALTDATRRGARYAVLHGEQGDDKCVKNAVIYGESHITAYPACDPGGASPLINGLTAPGVTVRADYSGDFKLNKGTATVSITGFTFKLGIPFIGKTLNMPAYASTLTAESAGTKPTDVNPPP